MVVGLVVLALVAFAVRPEGSLAGAAPLLDVEIAGCRSIERGPTCELPDDGVLRVWARSSPTARVTLFADRTPLVPESVDRVQGGSTLRVRLPADARVLLVRAASGGADVVHAMTLRPPTADAALRRAEALRRSGALADAAALLEEPLRDPSLARRARAVGMLARLDLARGRSAEAIDGLAEAAQLDRAAGLVSDEVRDRSAWSFALVYNGRRFGDARAALAPLDEVVAGDDEGRAMRPYYEAQIAIETGDLRSTLRLLRAAAEATERLGMTAPRADVLAAEAGALHRLGRSAERDARLDDAERSLVADASPCMRKVILTKRGFYAIEGRAPGELSPAELDSAFAALRAALAIDEGACPSATWRGIVLTDLALAELLAGRPSEARARIDEARRAHPSPDARNIADWLDIEGRIALARGEVGAALATYERLGTLASSAVLPDARWRASLGRAQSLAAAGDVDRATAAYAEAEGLVDDHALLVPLGEGRGTFFGRFEEGARLRVGFLLGHDPHAAMVAARRARSRALAALRWIDRVGAFDAGDRARWDDALAAVRRARDALDADASGDWKLAADELPSRVAVRRSREAELSSAIERAIAVLGREARPADEGDPAPPAPGELLLVYYPIPEGIAAFAVSAGRGPAPDDGRSDRQDPGDVSAHVITAVDAKAPVDELSRRLLAPFHDAIAAARRIRVLADGRLAAIDFHALPFDGAPLLAVAPVVYGVDLPAWSRATPAQDASAAHAAKAFVVADPRGDLPAARREIDAVARAIEQGGTPVQRVMGDEAARAVVRDLLERPGTLRFHYAGHGAFLGRDGWGSGLALAGQAWLSVSDILTLERAPARVVLSSCEAAEAATDSGAEGLGVAQAFLLAGSASVVAASRPVDDRLAARIMDLFYRSGAASAGDDAAALREAELAVMRESPDADWAGFRALDR